VVFQAIAFRTKNLFAFILILMVIFFETGCTDFHGDYGYELINEYGIGCDSIGPQIIEPYGTVSGDMFVEYIGVYEQYIYGDSYSYESRSPYKGYFIIDTDLHILQYFGSKSQLEDELKVLGLNQIELHDPYDFLVYRWVRRVLILIVLGVILTPSVLFTFRKWKKGRGV
tara:strand:- start:344 stop:853 length:510 start_codon:yes stop_codon:yes gene_type:complete